MKTYRNTRPQLIILAVAVLALVGAGTVLAQGPGGGRGRGAGEGRGGGRGEGTGLERLTERLDLTAEQQETITTIHEQSRQEGIEVRKELQRLRHELDGAMLEDEPDAGEVRKIAERIGDAETKLQVQRLERRLAVRATLTPEQRDLMLAWGDGPGRGGRHGGRQQAGRHQRGLRHGRCGGSRPDCPLEND